MKGGVCVSQRIHTSIRLQQVMDEKNMKQVDLLNAVKPLCDKYNLKITKGQLSQYLSGRNEPGQKRAFILAQALGVSDSWLIGFDVPKERDSVSHTPEERAKEFITLFRKLNDAEQLSIIQVMKGFLAGR